MMSVLTPEESTRGNLKNGVAENRTVPEIEWTADIRPHPCLRGGTRVRFRSEVNNMQRPVIRLLDALPHDLTFLTEAEVECIYFAYDMPQS
jgi:hypothetical protein